MRENIQMFGNACVPWQGGVYTMFLIVHTQSAKWIFNLTHVSIKINKSQAGQVNYLEVHVKNQSSTSLTYRQLLLYSGTPLFFAVPTTLESVQNYSWTKDLLLFNLSQECLEQGGSTVRVIDKVY